MDKYDLLEKISELDSQVLETENIPDHVYANMCSAVDAMIHALNNLPEASHYVGKYFLLKQNLEHKPEHELVYLKNIRWDNQVAFSYILYYFTEFDKGRIEGFNWPYPFFDRVDREVTREEAVQMGFLEKT